MLPPLRLAAVAAVLVFSVPVTAQPVFDPSDQLGTAGNVSGDDDCDIETPYYCNLHKESIRAQSGQADEMVSSLEFGFASGAACSLTSPRPVSGPQIVPSTRRWNECPNGQANTTYSLSTASLPGPDYGLNRLRVCTASNGTLQGVEARFFKLPHLGRQAPGQDVVTRQFARASCTTWEDWSTCPAGQSAASIRIFSQSANAGHVEGLQLVCKRVLANP